MLKRIRRLFSDAPLRLVQIPVRAINNPPNKELEEKIKLAKERAKLAGYSDPKPLYASKDKKGIHTPRP